MRAQFTENTKPDKIVFSVRNADTSGTQNTNNQINRGTPLVLNLSTTPQPVASADGNGAGWEDGLQVILPSTAGAVPTQHFQYGVALGAIAASQLGETMINGVCLASVEIVLTRSASSTVWASYASIAASFAMSIDTLNNAYQTYSTLQPSQGLPACVLLDSLASFTTNASTIGISSATSYASTVLARVFLRQM